MRPRTGWPPGLLQDDSRQLFGWFANRANARAEARMAAREAALTGSGEPTPLPDWRFWLTLSPFLAPWFVGAYFLFRSIPWN